MKHYVRSLAIATLVAVPCVSFSQGASNPPAPDQIISWANGQISTAEMEADLLKLKPVERDEMRKNPRALLQAIDNLHIYRELAARAKKSEFVTPQVQRSAEIAAERQIGLLYLNELLAKKERDLGDLTQAAREQYEAKKQKYDRPEARLVSHVLIATKDRTPEVAKQLAEKVLEEVKAGTNFADVASKYSDDQGSKRRGGMLGVLQRGKAVPAFEDAAFALTSVDQLSPLVQSEFGFHIIKLHRIDKAGLQPFDDVKQEIISELLTKAIGEYREQLLAEIRTDKSLQINKEVFEAYTGRKPERQSK